MSIMKKFVFALAATLISASAFAQYTYPLQSSNNLADISNLATARANLGISGAAPTISSGFGTGAAVANNNGTQAFTINVGTSSGNTGVIGLPTAAHGWACFATDITTNSTSVFVTKQTATTASSATIGNFSDVAVAGPWTNSDILSVSCSAY